MSERRLALAEYHLTGSEAVIFFATADHPQPDMITVPCDSNDLGRMVVTLTKALDVPHVNDLALQTVDKLLAAPLLDELLKPVFERLDENDDLYIVPHGPLHRLPLHAVLVDGERLVDRHPVVYSPSTSVLRYCQANRRTERHNAFVVGDSSMDPHLTFSDTQATAIARLFETQVLRGTAASNAEFRKRFAAGTRPPALLHINAHGVFDAEHPMESGLELPGGRLSAQQILDLNLTGTFVTLAACSSGVAATRPGDELLGLVRSLFYAGAPATLVSLWRVDELSTAMMLTEFYRRLAEGEPAVVALWGAQHWLRNRTAGDVVAYVEAVKVGECTVSPLTTRLEATLAHMLLTAGEHEAAAKAVDAAAASATNAEARRIADTLALRVRMIAWAGIAPDRNQKIYRHPYFWAPFVLIGDWY
jgi:CHAT domain-containing protein